MGRKRYSKEQIITILREAEVVFNGHIFDTLMEGKVLVEGWRKEYNRFRPLSSLGYRPPAPEAYETGKFTLGLAH